MSSSNGQPSRLTPHRQHMVPHTHSIAGMPQQQPALPVTPPTFPTAIPPTSISPMSVEAQPQDMHQAAHEHAIDFATHSWDLATGGLKTLTAKREFPPRAERRASEVRAEDARAARSYTLALAIMACVVLMLIGSGIVLFVMLQP